VYSTKINFTMLKKVYFLLIVTVLFCLHGFGQTKTDDLPLKAVSPEISKRVSEVYTAFSKSYTLLDAVMTGQCYAEKGITVSHYSDQVPSLVYGRPAIQLDFKNFFDRVIANKETLSIEFKIIERKTNGELVFDKGYYKVASSKEGQPLWTSYGKIAIVLEKDTKGNWKYSVDTNATATETEYTQAVSLQ
jgi:ketosteroid isomerase-like protein